MSEKNDFARDRSPEPIIAAYREKVLYTMAVIAATVVAPFSLLNFYKGYVFVGAVTITVVLVFLVDALAIYRKRPLPVPVPVAFAGVLFTLGVAIQERGLLGIFWTFPAILLFHFVLERRLANLFNLSLVAVVAVVSFRTLDSDVALRIAVGQLLTIAFTNIFSHVVEAEQRKETEQRRRLGLLVRATQAGFYQWDRGAAAVTYSGRLKEMLGYDADADTSGWPPFIELVHPEDREKRYELFQAGARDRSMRDGVRRHIAGDFRMARANGEPIWVHSEGLFIHDGNGVAMRYIASLIDVTERYRQEADLRRSNNQIGVQAQQLRDQNAALRSAIRVREEVERIARHDLRTPLNSILAVPRLLREERKQRDGRQLDAREEELLGMVEGAAYRILDLVNLSVDLYRMEQGEYRFSPRVVDLVGLAETVTREVRAHATTKGVRIELRVDGEPASAERRAFAWAEELLCYSVIANLLKNAVEASPDGGVVAIDFATTGPTATLRMHNAGVVPESVRGSFFEKYATYGKVGGFGLGTYSARLMARVQQGELSMSTSDGGGTVLELRLPALPPGASSALPGARAAGGAAPAKDERSLPRLRVLVVDDDEFNLAFVRGALPSPPLEVATAINGRAAVDAMRAQLPDVVFMDIEMPVMNGFDALERIRAMQSSEASMRGRRPLTVVAFSSYDDEAMRRRCRAGGLRYLSWQAGGAGAHPRDPARGRGRRRDAGFLGRCDAGLRSFRATRQGGRRPRPARLAAAFHRFARRLARRIARGAGGGRA